MGRIIVIGAGITGITTADALLERGHEVVVLERHPYAAMETSFANGGQLSASNAEVWNHPSTLIKGIKWLFRKDAPLRFHMRPSLHKYGWLAEFAAGLRGYRQNTVETVRLAIAARKHLFAIAEREQIDFDLSRRGILHIYDNDADLRHARRVNELLVAGGLDRAEVSASDIRGIEPTLQRDYAGGFYTPSDATGDIHKFTRALAASCARRGARLAYGADVSAINCRNDGLRVDWRPNDDARAVQSERADAVIVCAGVESRQLAASVGDRINIYPVKGYSITVHLDHDDAESRAPQVSLLDDAAKIVTSRLGAGRLRVAGTAEFAGVNHDIRADRIAPLVAWTRKTFPGIDTSRVVPWSGLRPMMPDMMPRVGPGRRRGIFYNTGHGHLGWTLSAATAQMVADAYESGVQSGA